MDHNNVDNKHQDRDRDQGKCSLCEKIYFCSICGEIALYQYKKISNGWIGNLLNFYFCEDHIFFHGESDQNLNSKERSCVCIFKKIKQ
jgi:hypothetical protein